MTTKLSIAAVRALIMAVLPTEDEATKFGLSDSIDFTIPIEGLVSVHGAINHFVFIVERLEAKREEVIELLRQLPDSFMASGGGGMSLMNMVVDKDHNLWGEQKDADLLYVLGAGLGLCTYVLPRDMWAILPGGMPYICIKLPVEEEARDAQA